MLSNGLWTLYSIKAQAWFDRASQLHRAYVASLSALGWLILVAVALIALGWSKQPFGVGDSWVWTQLIVTAVLASGMGGYFWNVGAARLGRGDRLAVGQSGAVFRHPVVDGVRFCAECLPDRRRLGGPERSGVHAGPQATDTHHRMTDTLKARNCRWIAVPGAADARGKVNFLQLGKGLDFQPKRFFWLHSIAAGQWRGRHAHRESQLLFVAMHGACQVHLDDGTVKETVTLDDPAKALYMAPWIWHELTDFSPEAAILVVASTLFDEAEYLRDYEAFRKGLPTR